jgi:Domain of unknown function (DUF4331)
MTMRMRPALLPAALLVGGWLLAPALMLPGRMTASDHADTAENFNRIGADMTDVFLFPSPVDNNNVVVVMDVHGLIPAGQGGNVSFDPQVLYQMKFDITGDYVEDLVIQVRFVGNGPNQAVVVSGPAKPIMTGTTTAFGRPHATIGTINQTFSPAAGMQVFAGVRSEPFFFDLNRFYAILPDRMTPLTGQQVNFPSIMAANTPQVNGFRGFPAGSGFDTTPAVDFLANLNVLSIVVELPRSALGGGKVNLWETTSLPNGFVYLQQDRLARPAVNEVLATVTANRHEVNNKDNPTDDVNQLKGDIQSFMTFPAGRSAAIGNALASVLVPDVLVADLSVMNVNASYLGVETGGFTGGKFGGRALADDVVDIDLMAIFGPVIPKLGLAPDDGNESPQFETDNVGPHKDFLNTFPYLGNPH